MHTNAAAENAQRSIIDIASLIAVDRKKTMATKDGTVQAIRLFGMLPTMPRFTSNFAADKLDVTFPTARSHQGAARRRCPGRQQRTKAEPAAQLQGVYRTAPAPGRP